MIVKPDKMDFSGKNIVIILSGLPGTGKTTLAESAPGCLLIDIDEGLARIKPEHRTDASMCKTYEEVLADVEAAKGVYPSLGLDTVGGLIELMKDWAMRTDPKASKANGGFSLQGYGIIKSEFIRLMADLRKHFNVVLVFHEQIEKDDDGGIFYSLVVEGSARTLVYQPADLAGHCFVQNGKRYIGFSPTEKYSAKSAYGISGIIEVPTLNDGDPNDFLTRLFARVRESLQKEAEGFGEQKDVYDAALAEAKRICAAVNTPEDVAPASSVLKKLPHALTSEKESMNILRERLNELGIVWDKAAKKYKYADK